MLINKQIKYSSTSIQLPYSFECHLKFKGYLCYKTILCHKAAIFVFFWNLQISKFVTSSKVLLHDASYAYAYFFWILSPIKMKFGQILLCCMTNISNMFLAECWRLETSSRLFYDFIKMTIQQDLAIFNSWHIPFLIVFYSPFQKNGTLGSWHIWLLSDWGRLLN